MADSPHGPDSFESAWASFGRTSAVAAAALVALAGVLAHVPVWLASLRGLATLVVVLVLVRAAIVVARALPKPPAAERTQTARKERG